MPSSPNLVNGAVIASAALAVLGAIQYWGAETAYQRDSPDVYKVAEQSARLADFRAAVPADAILGYLTDVPTESTVGSTMFFAAQYALAPRLLQKTDALDLVLGNFTKPGDYTAIGKQHALRVVRDFGNGIVLFRKEARQ
ncbi:MAG TPA: hypothetical protein VGL53_00045 [Bryobacteraceae bacterium]|jgi:hypothetical protein